jgi:hypothetical protein
MSSKVANRVESYRFWFEPSSANVTTGGSGTFSNGYLIGPGNSAVDAAFSIVTSFDDLSSRAEYAAVFDKFRIRKVEYHFIPVGDVQPNGDDLGAATTVVAKPQLLEACIDLDDNTAPTTIGELLENETYRFTRPSQTMVVKYSPRVAREVFDGVTASFEEPRGPVWVDCAQQTTPHYGMKLWVNTNGATSNIQNMWLIRGRMDIDFARTK